MNWLKAIPTPNSAQTHWHLSKTFNENLAQGLGDLELLVYIQVHASQLLLFGLPFHLNAYEKLDVFIQPPTKTRLATSSLEK